MKTLQWMGITLISILVIAGCSETTPPTYPDSLVTLPTVLDPYVEDTDTMYPPFVYRPSFYTHNIYKGPYQYTYYWMPYAPYHYIGN